MHRSMESVEARQLPSAVHVAKHKAVDYWRRTSSHRYLALPVPVSTWAPPLELWLQDTKALKPVHRACLILRYVHGMSREEIAQHTGPSAVQVKGHLKSGRPRRELKGVSGR